MQDDSSVWDVISCSSRKFIAHSRDVNDKRCRWGRNVVQGSERGGKR